MKTNASIAAHTLPSGRVEVLLEGTTPGAAYACKRKVELFELPPGEATDTFMAHLKRFAEQ
jgi:hypothetical protein